MADHLPADFYCDSFQTNVGPYGAALNFLLTSPEPQAPGQQPRIDRLATVRMSLEHMKMMAFLLRNQVKAYEEQTGVRIQIPREVLNSLRIGSEDWDSFWK